MATTRQRLNEVLAKIEGRGNEDDLLVVAFALALADVADAIREADPTRELGDIARSIRDHV